MLKTVAVIFALHMLLGTDFAYVTTNKSLAALLGSNLPG